MPLFDGEPKCATSLRRWTGQGPRRHTIAAYRDSLRLLLCFAQQQTGKPPSRLDLADVDAPLIGAFLVRLERERHATPGSRRSTRCSATPRCATPSTQQASPGCSRSPPQRHRKTTIAYLNRSEINALLAAPDRATWVGRRDHAMLLVAIQTGVRVSELINLTIAQASLTTGAHLRVIGKGDKERCAILTNETAAVLRAWLRERQGQPHQPLFPTRRGEPLTTRASSCGSTSTPPQPPAHARHSALKESLRARCSTPTRCCSEPRTSTSTRSRSGSDAPRLESTEIYLHADTELKHEAIPTRRTDRHPTGPLPAARHAPRVPRSTVTI